MIPISSRNLSTGPGNFLVVQYCCDKGEDKEHCERFRNKSVGGPRGRICRDKSYISFGSTLSNTEQIPISPLICLSYFLRGISSLFGFVVLRDYGP